jgi:hypothetical protein
VAVATDGSGAANGVRGGVTEPAHLGDERTTLLGFLQRQRDLVEWKVREASDETLASVRMPSGLTLHGIVRHLENVERGWFRDFFAGQTGLGSRRPGGTSAISTYFASTPTARSARSRRRTNESFGLEVAVWGHSSDG